MEHPVLQQRDPEMEAEHWSAEVAPVIKKVNEEVSPTEEKSPDNDEVATGKDVPSTETEGGFVMCEIGGEQQSVRVEAPPQKRRVVISVESDETQDYVSGQRGFEDLGQEETEELGFCSECVQGTAMCLSHVCDKRELQVIPTEEGGAAHTINLCKQCYNEKESYKFFQLAAIVTEEGGATHTIKKRATSSSNLRLL